MALIDLIKARLPGYQDHRDIEIQSMINEAISYFKGAGWAIDPLSPTPLAVGAITLHCKMAQSTDPKDLVHHPVLISYIAQARRGDPGPHIEFPEEEPEEPEKPPEVVGDDTEV